VRQDPGGLAPLLFGIFFFVVGSSFAVNLGGVHRLLRKDGPVPAALQKLPPWRWGTPNERTRARIVGSFFAVTGFVSILVGVYRIGKGDV
jgi:hypothetical protein